MRSIVKTVEPRGMAGLVTAIGARDGDMASRTRALQKVVGLTRQLGTQFSQMLYAEEGASAALIAVLQSPCVGLHI